MNWSGYTTQGELLLDIASAQDAVAHKQRHASAVQLLVFTASFSGGKNNVLGVRRDDFAIWNFRRIQVDDLKSWKCEVVTALQRVLRILTVIRDTLLNIDISFLKESQIEAAKIFENPMNVLALISCSCVLGEA